MHFPLSTLSPEPICSTVLFGQMGYSSKAKRQSKTIRQLFLSNKYLLVAASLKVLLKLLTALAAIPRIQVCYMYRTTLVPRASPSIARYLGCLSTQVDIMLPISS
ncbi:UNVERIFIED_CONTAM: hypothetical protein K2H54_058933 [Gekko kuhli]